jgi:hypothetical protein
MRVRRVTLSVTRPGHGWIPITKRLWQHGTFQHDSQLPYHIIRRQSI